MSQRVVGYASLLVVLTLISVHAGAQSCADPSPPTVSLSMSGPNTQGQATATITYSFPSWVSARSVSLWFDGDQIMFTRPGTSSGTITVNVDTTCWRTGNHFFEAEAVSCNKFGEPGYFTRSGITTISGSTDPQLTSFTITELDTLGHSNAAIGFNFPNTSGSSQRAISLWHEGVQLFYTEPSAQSGTVNIPINTACWRTGTHALEAELTACKKWDDPDYAANQIATIERSTKPTLTMSIVGPDAAGQATAELDYTFPNTDTANRRAVSLWIDGVQTHYVEPTVPNDHWSIPIDMSCWTSGTHRIEAEATACKLWDDPDYSVTQGQDVVIGPEEGQFVQVTPLRGEKDTNGRRKINLEIEYGFSPFAANRRVTLELLRWTYADGTTEPGRVLFSTPVSTATGTIHYTFTPDKDAQEVTFLGIAESCAGRATDEVSVECGNCDSSSNPVYFTDGNMRLSDTDPLPPISAWPLTRTYNSDEQIVALFGRGWTTLFDRRLIANTDGADQVISIITETNEVATFRKTGGVFTQRWPKARHQKGSLTYDAAAGTYTHRAAGSTEAAVFASDGRLMALRDLSTGREAQVAYNAQGFPASLTDSWSGVKWQLAYESGQRRVKTVTVNTRPDIAWNYTYDANGNLTKVEIGPDTWRTYVYDENRMTESRDAAGNLIESHEYDADGYATSSTGNVDEIATIQYNLPSSNPEERITRVTEKNGAITEYVLVASGSAWRPARVVGGCGSCGTRDKTFVRDALGRVIREQTADGYVTVSTYDNDHLLSEERYLAPTSCNLCRLDPAALASEALQTSSASIATTFEYGDPAWPDRPTSITEPSVAVLDASRTTTTEYHSQSGRVKRTHTSGWTGPEPSQTDQATQTTFYGDPPASGEEDQDPASDPFAPSFDPGGSWVSLPQPSGLVKSIDGPRIDADDVTAFVYYPIDPSVAADLRGRLAATKNAAGHITRFENYDVFGNPLRVVDPNGVATEMTYDTLGRLRTSTIKGVPGCDTAQDPLCATDLTTTRTYSAAGPLASEQRPGGGSTVYGYDSRGRVHTISRGPSSTDLRERIEYTYDPNTGQKSAELLWAFENGSWVERTRESFSYDSLRQLQAVTHADETAVHYAYDSEGRVASVRDEIHASPNTLYEYDPAGRVSEVRQTLSSAPGGFITTSYGYDVHGNLVSVTDPNGNETTYAYDDFGRMVSQVSPVTHTTLYTYDEAGNLTSTTDARGAVTERRYDALNRPVGAVSTNGGSIETVAWTYDDPSVGRFAIGRVASMSDPAGATTYDYERRGLLRRESRTFVNQPVPPPPGDGDGRGLSIGTTSEDRAPGTPAWSATTSFTYDRDGNRNSIAYPSGQLTVTYAFDYAGRPVSAAGFITSATYLPFGPLTQLRFANGTTQTMPHDTRYRMSSNELTIDGVPEGQGRLARYTYGYDNAGNILSLLDGTDSAYHRHFVYDDLNRLVEANTKPETPNNPSALWNKAKYTWDAMGNILSASLAEVEPGGPDELSATNPKRFQPPNKARKQNEAIVQPLGRTMQFSYSGTTPIITAVTLNDLSHSMTHDEVGNETYYVVTRSYSPRNLLQLVTDAAEPEEQLIHRLAYGYDGRGVRVTRAESPSNGLGTIARRYYVYTPELALLAASRDDSPNVWGGNPPSGLANNIDYEIVWFGNRPVAQVSEPTGTRAYTFADHLGTPILQTDATRTVTWRVEYEPFGNVYEVRAGTRLDQPLRFPGQELAMTWEGPEENYNIFRWYRAGWGRYTQADPLGLEGGLNLYLYATGAPTVNFDPLGLTVNVRCRRVGRGFNLFQPRSWAGAVGFRHCYLEVTCPKAGVPPTTISYLGGNPDTQVVENHSVENADVRNTRSGNFDQYRAQPPRDSDNCNCEFEKCVVDLAKRFAQENYTITNYNAALGPNSNSFAHRLILECGGRIPGRPPRAPGWSTPWNE